MGQFCLVYFNQSCPLPFLFLQLLKKLLHAVCTKTEFMYPETWVADQTIFYRAVEKAELERSLDPPPLNSGTRRKRNVNEPVIAFGPPGSTGELNVSVIVSPVPLDFR